MSTICKISRYMPVAESEALESEALESEERPDKAGHEQIDEHYYQRATEAERKEAERDFLGETLMEISHQISEYEQCPDPQEYPSFPAFLEGLFIGHGFSTASLDERRCLLINFDPDKLHLPNLWVQQLLDQRAVQTKAVQENVRIYYLLAKYLDRKKAGSSSLAMANYLENSLVEELPANCFTSTPKYSVPSML